MKAAAFLLDQISEPVSAIYQSVFFGFRIFGIVFFFNCETDILQKSIKDIIDHRGFKYEAK